MRILRNTCEMFLAANKLNITLKQVGNTVETKYFSPSTANNTVTHFK